MKLGTTKLSRKRLTTFWCKQMDCPYNLGKIGLIQKELKTDTWKITIPVEFTTQTEYAKYTTNIETHATNFYFRPDKMPQPEDQLPDEEVLAYCILYFVWYFGAFLYATAAIVIATCMLLKGYKSRLHYRFLTNEILKSVLGRRTLTVHIDYEKCHRCHLPRQFCNKYVVKTYRI